VKTLAEESVESDGSPSGGPAPFLLAGIGATLAGRALWQRRPRQVADLAVVTAVWLAVFVPQRMQGVAFLGEQVRDALVYIEANREPGDRVLLYSSAAIIADYYTEHVGYEPYGSAAPIRLPRARHDPQQYLDLIDALPPGRYWALLAHDYGGPMGSEFALIKARLELRGGGVDAVVLKNAEAHLYEIPIAATR